ncbi:Crp/Fnr family transcriptional regulator [Caulobacter sp. 73W]|uniref:Crp/Fnr family transcriptional regulator n=1 Tax=Caulobacter sp. 73W TaxID=3161137 RepID=A0AB39KYA1_9CAUL
MSVDHLIAKLRRRDDIAPSEAQYLQGLLDPPRRVSRGAEIVRAGERPGHSTLLVDGFCSRIVTGPTGARQITQVNIGGDFLDLHSFLMKQMDHGCVALTDCTIMAAPHAKLRRMTDEQPHLTRLLWLETVIDAAIHRQWLYGLGRLEAQARTAHLMCELALRSRAAGLGGPEGFPMPFTQPELADILGITPVHANRSMMTLRRAGLIERTGMQVIIIDWDGLAELGEFDPAYLRLYREPV